MSTVLRVFFIVIFTGIVAVLLQNCFGPVGMAEIKYTPLPLVIENNRLAKYQDSSEDVSIEIRKEPVSKPVENLAIHYPALFPDGEPVHPGDREEYVTVNGKTAYKVVFNTKYIRKRKRFKPQTDIPPGWSESTWEDPISGKKTPILVGPVIPQRKILYVAPGSENVYYVLLKVDGTDHEDSIKKFDEFVRQGIDYR